MFAVPSMQYTPGGYTLDGYCMLDPRSIEPVGNVTVHWKLPEILSAITLAGPIPLISEFAPIVIGAPLTVPIRWLFAVPSMQYTPGGYTLSGYCMLDPRSIAPVGNVIAH